MGKKKVVPSAKTVKGRGRGMGVVNTKKAEPKTVNVDEAVSKEYVKSIDAKEQARVSALKPALLKDDYFIGRYKDADAETVQKSLLHEFSNAKDDETKRSILKEIGIVGDVIKFRKTEDYGDKRRKYEKNIYKATANVLGDGRTSIRSLSPAQQRTAKNAIGIEKNIYDEIGSATKELSRFDFSKMGSEDIKKLIDSAGNDVKSSSLAKSSAAQYKVSFLNQKFNEKKAEESVAQYKSDEDFIRNNFGGVSYGFVERSVKSLKTEQKRLVSDVASLSQAISMYKLGRAPKGTDVVALRTELAQKQKRLDDVNEQLPVLERYEKATKEKMEEENNRVLYGSIEKSADFSEKSKIDVDFWNSTQNKEGHALYGYINDLTHQNGKSYRDIFSNYDGTLGHSDWDVYKYLSETERGKFNYLYNSGRYAAAQNYLSTLDLDLSKRRYEKDSAMWAKNAEEHPVLTSMGTVVTAPWTAYTSLGAVAYDAADVARGKEIDPYSGLHRQGNKTNVTRDTVTENIDSDFGKFMYGVSMSIGDNLANMAVGSVLGVGALNAGASKEAAKKVISGFVSTSMGTTSAGQSIVRNKQRGLSDEVALGLGLAQGFTEMLTEKYSIETIMKHPKSALLGVLRGMAAEGSEELVSGVVTTSLDYLVTGSDSEISKLIADYKEKGYSDKDAVDMALFMSLGEQALAGAVSGGVLAGGYSLLGRSGNATRGNDGGKIISDAKRPDVVYQIEDEDGKVLSTDGNSGGNISDFDKVIAMGDNDAAEVAKKKIRAAESITENEYLELAKEPVKNKERLQNIVDEKAVEAGVETDSTGKPLDLYHGTRAFGFTKIDNQYSQDELSFFATEDIDVANTYARLENARTGEIGKNSDSWIEHTEESVKDYFRKAEERGLEPTFSATFLDDSQRMEYARKYIDSAKKIANKLLKSAELTENDANIINRFLEFAQNENIEGLRSMRGALKFDSIGKEPTSRYERQVVDFCDALADVFEYTAEGSFVTNDGLVDNINYLPKSNNNYRGIYRLYAKPNRTYVLDCKGAKWNRLPVSREIYDYAHNEYKTEDLGKKDVTTRAVASWAFENGYDSVRFLNVIDTGTGDKIKSNVWAFKNPQHQLWSADPVTYDGDGNVIPVSKRFSDMGDLRYSIESETTEKSGITYDDMMSGNITEEVREQKENFEAVVNRAGFQVVYATDRNVPKGTIGYVDFKNREIYISPEHFSKSLLNHELTHVIDQGYDGKYVKSLISFFKGEMLKDWNESERAIRDKYKKIAEENPGFTYSERTIEAETLAEMCSRLSTDKYIKSAANMKVGTIRQIAVMFRYMWSKMRYHFGDNSEARKMKIASMKWQMALYRAVNEGKANSTGIAFSSNVEEYPYNMQTVIKEYLEFKDEGLYDMVKAFRNDPKTSIRSYVMGDVAERLAAGINEKIGVDVREFSCAINKNGVEHIENNHGVNGKTDKSMANMNDTARIPYVLNNFDTIEVLYEGEKPALSKVYKNADNSKAQMVRISKKINGTFYTVLAVPDSANKRVWVVSAYINKNDGITQDSNADTALETTSKNELASLPSDVIISQSSEKNNKNISTDNDMLFAVADDEGSAGQDSGSQVRDASALEEEIGIIDEALEDKSLSKDDRLALIKDRVRLKRELSEIAGEKKEDKPTRREKVLEEYRETEDVGVLPDRDEIRVAENYDKKKISEYRKEFAELQEALRNQEGLSLDDVEELKMRRDAVVTRLSRVSENNSVLSEMKGILDELGVVEDPDHSWVKDIAEELSDKQNVIKYGTYNQNDIERNFRHFFGKHFKTAYEKIIQPLYDSKKDYVDGVKEYAGRLKTDVVDNLGIKKGSRESAAVMWLGEGKRPLSKKELAKTYGKEGAKKKIAEAKTEGQSEVFIEYSYEDCKKDFGEETARNIQKATEVFRKMYDELIADVNKTRSEIYPNNPDKLVKKRNDYFHHFQEMSKGFTGLRNILSTNIGIDPMLVGTSEHTKPKSKWAAYMQERTGNRTEYDAVAGFLDYLPAAQYSIHIDPNIVNVRALAKELAFAKASEYGEHGNSNANGFIAYLQKYANSLAGKTTSLVDRAVNDSNFGRTATAVIGWLNNKTKASAVLGNLNSVLAQVTNLKNVIGKIEHQSDVIRGAVDALGGLNPDGNIAARYKDSGFLGERYLGKTFSQFDTKWQKVNPVKWAADVLGFADEIGTRITWNAGYNEAVRKGVENPVQYADNFTRASVAGRGIGEEALVFKSQIAKMFLPFRTEVLNDLRVQQDILFGKDDDGKKVAVGKRIKNIMQLYVASMVINAVIAAVKGDEFDPVDEAKEGAEEKGILGALESVLRDYADGTGDPVAFDPTYDIVTGIYQGIGEGESAGGKIGKAAQRTVQNLTGDYVSNNPFSSAAMGIVGIDSDASDMLFNGKVYSPGGMGMPLASNMSTVFRELSQEDILSAGVAAIKPFFPLGTQIDRSVKGLYDYSKGYATTEVAYERMTGQDGDLKYLIEQTPGNFARSLLFGSGAFSGESDAFYNDKTRKFTEEEQAEILSKSDYDSRKVTFDEILAGRVYNSEEEERKTLVAEEFFRDDEDSVLYEIYSSGEDAALPYRNMGVSSSFTDSKTKKKYTLKLSAKEAEKITDEMCTVIAKRFDRANESDVFSTMTREEQVKYLDGVKNAEYEFAKISALHDKGQMSDEDFFRFETNYKKAEAERDRAIYIDDASLYVEYNVADTVGQYASYTDVPISEEGYEQLRAWSEYASTREPDDVDRELMRLSNATDSSINVAGNPYGIINYTKSGIEYKISMPDNKIYALCDEVDKAVRSALNSLFNTTAYLNSSAEVQKDMVASVKRKVRDSIKDKYKVRYKSVKIDDFDKVINMGK